MTIDEILSNYAGVEGFEEAEAKQAIREAIENSELSSSLSRPNATYSDGWNNRGLADLRTLGLIEEEDGLED